MFLRVACETRLIELHYINMGQSGQSEKICQTIISFTRYNGIRGDSLLLTRNAWFVVYLGRVIKHLFKMVAASLSRFQ